MALGKTITNGKLTIILTDHALKDAINLAIDTTDVINNPDEKGYKCTPQEYLKGIERLCRIAERIVDEYPSLDIFSMLPLTKSGDFPQDQSILIADTKLTNTWNGEYFSQSRLQLRLIERYTTYEDVDNYKNIPNKLFLIINEYNAGNSLTPPVFDENDVPHAVEKVRMTYIKDKDIKAGVIYADKKGTEYLYLGCIAMAAASTDIYRDGRKDTDGIQEVKTATMDTPLHVYQRVTKKLTATTSKYSSIQEYLDALITDGWEKKHEILPGLSVRDTPRKFTEEKDTIFTNTHVEDHILTMSVVDWGNFTAQEHIRVTSVN